MVFLGSFALVFVIHKVHIAPDPIEPVTFDMLYVPDYPNAQQVQVWTKPNADDWANMAEPYKRVTFVTSDTPQQVFTFYKDKLRSRNPVEDWRVDTAPTRQSGDTLEIFGWALISESPPMFIFTVRAEQGNDALQVTIERYTQAGS